MRISKRSLKFNRSKITHFLLKFTQKNAIKLIYSFSLKTFVQIKFFAKIVFGVKISKSLPQNCSRKHRQQLTKLVAGGAIDRNHD